ncbi:hypothetical protein C2857_005790 [Epichloe festucae Fl1]|uniref:Uncharacterized protein n=1 Tax=Epichloe festucae (strain Fl1) TaxID=877507 RepID=A0A7S9KSZ2_EPIFF|nr:hypothetical protein C2857_005790 [Epichloe festucae Fl1]
MEPQRGAPLRASRHHQSTRRRDENQERAYIAASRRTDRSIEARLQSAHKASELHKKRTGKSLHITEQIVFNDETYEEEDGWTRPPSRSVLGPQLQTPSADFNSRVEAYLEQKIVMSTFVAAAEDRQQTHPHHGWGEIDRLFAESFPNAAQTARRLAEDMVMVPGLPANQPPPPPPPQAGEAPIFPGLDGTGTTCAERWSIAAAPSHHQAQEAGADDAPHAAGDELPSGSHDPGDLHHGSGSGSGSGSAFTADLPPEVLLFLGHEGDDARGYHPDDGLKGGRHDAGFGGFANAGAAFCSDDDDTQRDVGGEDAAAVWNDELDAYLDSTAWLGLPAEGQCQAMEGEESR